MYILLHDTNIISFFPGYKTYYCETGWLKESYVYIAQTNVLEAVIEKYSLECIFIYNFVFPNVSFFFVANLFDFWENMAMHLFLNTL